MIRQRSAWLFAATLFVGGSILFAEPSIVRTKDGNTFQGEVTDRGDDLIINRNGINITVHKADVASVEAVGNYPADFETKLAALGPRDVAGRVALANDAMNRQQPDLARKAAEAALAIDPTNADAAAILRQIDSLNRAAALPPSTAAADAPPVPAGGTIPLLSDSDIDAIKRKELQRADVGARIRFDGDVKKKYADSQNIPFAAFNQLPPTEQALEILDRGTDEMKLKIHVMSDPLAIVEFRRLVEPLAVRNCSTSGCHGGTGGGNLMLVTAPGDPQAVTYTNFYILGRYSKVTQQSTGSVFGGAAQRMINRGHGEQSLLPSFGLPVTVATFDHPLVGGKPIQPIFRNKNDERYLNLVAWIDSLSQIDPDYGIKYNPPGNAPLATQPDQTR